MAQTAELTTNLEHGDRVLATLEGTAA